MCQLWTITHSIYISSFSCMQLIIIIQTAYSHPQECMIMCIKDINTLSIKHNRHAYVHGTQNTLEHNLCPFYPAICHIRALYDARHQTAIDNMIFPHFLGFTQATDHQKAFTHSLITDACMASAEMGVVCEVYIKAVRLLVTGPVCSFCIE